MTILFVCTGNTCRSPMAALYCRHLLRRLKRDEIRVDSAGVSAWTGAPLSDHAREALALAGVPAPENRSQAVSAETVRNADLILVMTTDHRDMLIDRFPGAKAKTRLLQHFAGAEADIPDPFGGPLTEYVACLDNMKPALKLLVEWLCEHTGETGGKTAFPT